MSASVDIHGHCELRFQEVYDVFARSFEDEIEVGASVSAVLDGVTVVDLWAGHRDAARTKRWEENTIVNVYSTTKAMAALCALMLVDRGALDLDAPVAAVWPEFAQSGKDEVRVRHVLSHTSGLAGWDETISNEDLFNWEHCADLLAAQAPWWEPGSKSGYQSLTHGYLLGEIVRRVSGRSLGQFFRQEVSEPLSIDFHIGLDASHDARVADLIPPEPARGTTDAPPLSSIARRVFANPPLTTELTYQREWRAAEIPAANGHGNARSVARVAGALARGGGLDGVVLLGSDTIDAAIEEQISGIDLVLGIPMRFGLGFGLATEAYPLGPNARSFYWDGYGGSVIVADPDAKLGFSYVMNRMNDGMSSHDPRAWALMSALFRGLNS